MEWLDKSSSNERQEFKQWLQYHEEVYTNNQKYYKQRLEEPDLSKRTRKSREDDYQGSADLLHQVQGILNVLNYKS